MFCQFLLSLFPTSFPDFEGLSVKITKDIMLLINRELYDK